MRSGITRARASLGPAVAAALTLGSVSNASSLESDEDDVPEIAARITPSVAPRLRLVQMHSIVRHGSRTPAMGMTFDPSEFVVHHDGEEPWHRIRPVGYPGERLPPPREWFTEHHVAAHGQLTEVGYQQSLQAGRNLGSAIVAAGLEIKTEQDVYARATSLVRTLKSCKGLLSGIGETGVGGGAIDWETIPIASRPDKVELTYPNHIFMSGGSGVGVKPLRVSARAVVPQSVEDARSAVASKSRFSGPLVGEGMSFDGEGLTCSQLMDGIAMRVAEGVPIPVSLGETHKQSVKRYRALCHGALREVCARLLVKHTDVMPQLPLSPDNAAVTSALAAGVAPLLAEILDRLRLLAAQYDDEETQSSTADSRNWHLQHVASGERRAAQMDGSDNGVIPTDPALARQAVAQVATFPSTGAHQPKLLVTAAHDSTMMALLAALAGTASAAEAVSANHDVDSDRPLMEVMPWPQAVASLRMEVYQVTGDAEPTNRVLAPSAYLNPEAFGAAFADMTGSNTAASAGESSSSLRATLNAVDKTSLLPQGRTRLTRSEAARRAVLEMQRLMSAGHSASDAEKAVWQSLEGSIASNATMSPQEAQLRESRLHQRTERIERESWQAKERGRASAAGANMRDVEAAESALAARQAARMAEAQSLRAADAAVSAVWSNERLRVTRKAERQAAEAEADALRLRLNAMLGAVKEAAAYASSRVRRLGDAATRAMAEASADNATQNANLRAVVASRAGALVAAVKHAADVAVAAAERTRHTAEEGALLGAKAAVDALVAMEEMKARSAAERRASRALGATEAVQALKSWVERSIEATQLDGAAVVAKLVCRVEEAHTRERGLITAVATAQQILQQERALREAEAAVAAVREDNAARAMTAEQARVGELVVAADEAVAALEAGQVAIIASHEQALQAASSAAEQRVLEAEKQQRHAQEDRVSFARIAATAWSDATEAKQRQKVAEATSLIGAHTAAEALRAAETAIAGRVHAEELAEAVEHATLSLVTTLAEAKQQSDVNTRAIHTMLKQANSDADAQKEQASLELEMVTRDVAVAKSKAVELQMQVDAAEADGWKRVAQLQSRVERLSSALQTAQQRHSEAAVGLRANLQTQAQAREEIVTTAGVATAVEVAASAMDAGLELGQIAATSAAEMEADAVATRHGLESLRLIAALEASRSARIEAEQMLEAEQRAAAALIDEIARRASVAVKQVSDSERLRADGAIATVTAEAEARITAANIASAAAQTRAEHAEANFMELQTSTAAADGERAKVGERVALTSAADRLKLAQAVVSARRDAAMHAGAEADLRRRVLGLQIALTDGKSAHQTLIADARQQKSLLLAVAAEATSRAQHASMEAATARAACAQALLRVSEMADMTAATSGAQRLESTSARAALVASQADVKRFAAAAAQADKQKIHFQAAAAQAESSAIKAAATAAEAIIKAQSKAEQAESSAIKAAATAAEAIIKASTNDEQAENGSGSELDHSPPGGKGSASNQRRRVWVDADFTKPPAELRQPTTEEQGMIAETTAVTLAQIAPKSAKEGEMMVRFVYCDTPLRLCEAGELCRLDEAAEMLARHAGPLERAFTRFGQDDARSRV